MLTPTSPQTLPALSTCDQGRLVAGATVAQIAIGALNLASVKMLGEAHYHLQRVTVGFAASLFEINQIIKATECQIEQIDVVTNLAWEEACRKREAARDAINGRLCFGKEGRHARIALEGHAATGGRDFRSGRWRAR